MIGLGGSNGLLNLGYRKSLATEEYIFGASISILLVLPQLQAM